MIYSKTTVERVVELKAEVRELPYACLLCPVLYARDFCGLAINKESSLRAMGTERIPSGCVNKLGGLKAEEIKPLKLI